MKVVEAITTLGVGGAERVVLALASHAARTNVEVTIVCFSSDVDALQVYGSYHKPTTFEMKRGIVRAVLSLIAYARFLRAYRPDLVHAHLYHAFVLTIVAQVLSLTFCPIVFTLHNSWCPPARALTLQITKAWRRADIVFSDSERDRPWQSRAVVIPNGVDIGGMHPRQPWSAETGPNLIFVGRLVPQKDPVELLHALSRELPPHWRLTVVGVGPEMDQMMTATEELGLSGQVEFLGRRSDVRRLLQKADIFLCYSHFEGLPMAILEAGAEGMVVVSTPVGSIPAVLGNDCGYLATKADFGRTLRMVIANPANALRRAAKLHSRVSEHYSTDAMVRAHLSLYREVCANPAQRSDVP